MEVQLYLKGKEKGDQCRCKSTLPAEPFFYLLDFCVLQKDSRGMEYAGHVREHLQISEGRSSDCSDVISEILVHISDQIGRSSVVYRICGIGIPKGQHPTHVHVSTSTEIRSSS